MYQDDRTPGRLPHGSSVIFSSPDLPRRGIDSRCRVQPLSKVFLSFTSHSGSSFHRLLVVAAILLLPWLQADAHGTHSSLLAKVDARLAARPDDGELWYQRAVLMYEHEEFETAAIDFAKAEEFASGKYAVLWWRGRIFDHQGKLPEAKAALDQQLAKTPEHWGTLASRARVQMKLGANAEALADFRTALANCKDIQPDLIQEVAQALASHDRVDEAVAVLESCMQKLGPIPSLQLKLLEIEVEADRYAKALARLNAIESSASRKEPWMEKRAIILAQAGFISESQAAWRALIAHLESMSPAERDSHAMIILTERAHQALAVLRVSTSPDPSPFTSFSHPQNR